MPTNLLLQRLQSHLHELNEHQDVVPNEKILDQASLSLVPTLSKDESRGLITELVPLLTSLQHDPTPITQLLEQLLRPYSFAELAAFRVPIDYVTGLSPSAQPFNHLVLSILEKAADVPSDANIIATRPEVAYALVKLWLVTNSEGIATKAQNVIDRLLSVDSDTDEAMTDLSLRPNGMATNLMLRRLFGDKDVYELFFAACSNLSQHPEFMDVSRSRRTISQARLLHLLPHICALDWTLTVSSNHIDIEKAYRLKSGEGLLHFAAIYMVDYGEDILMHMSLIQFYGDLLSAVDGRGIGNNPALTDALEFLTKNRLHRRSLEFYLNPKPNSLDSSLLYGASSEYLSTYARIHTRDFIASDFNNATINRLHAAFAISPAKFIQDDAINYDLRVLALLPRDVLFLRNSPLLSIPSRTTKPNALRALAEIFRGPARRDECGIAHDTMSQEDLVQASAARALYYLYLNHNPDLFKDLVTHGDIVALTDVAITAIDLIIAIIESNWEPLPASTDSDSMPTPNETRRLPSEQELIAQFPSPSLAMADDGAVAVLSPPSLEYTLPFLVHPPKTFSNIVGGVGDTSSAAYRVARARFDALTALQKRLRKVNERVRDENFDEILVMLDRRISRGPWTRENDVGGAVGTLEL